MHIVFGTFQLSFPLAKFYQSPEWTRDVFRKHKQSIITTFFSDSKCSFAKSSRIVCRSAYEVRRSINIQLSTKGLQILF